MSSRGQSLLIDLGWHQSEEGQSALAHLRDPVTGSQRRIFGKFNKWWCHCINLFEKWCLGLLEKPSVPPSFNQVFYKLAVLGKSGVGKTALVCLLSNQRDLVASSQIPPGETPGVRVTTVYWPAKINRSHIFLFQLDFWDCGETASKKYNHILPVSIFFIQKIVLIDCKVHLLL